MIVSLLAHQLRFVKSNEPHPAIVGGLGSGKSQAATMRAILTVIREPGINHLIGMPTYDLIRMRMMPGVEADLQQLGIPYSVNKTEWAIDLHGFGKIYFRSYDRPERWIAFEVAHTTLDELDTLNKEKASTVWRKANERTRQHSKHGNTIANVTTPDHGIHGFTYEKWVKKKQKGYELIKASTLDNFYLPESYVEQIRNNYDPLLAEMYLNGEFVSLNDKKVYHQFNREQCHTDREWDKKEKLHIGLDFNIGGTTASVWVLDGTNIIAVDEFVSHDTQDFVSNLIARYNTKNLIIYPDASGNQKTTNASQSDIAIIESAGFAIDAPNANPPVRDRVNSVNRLYAQNRIKINCSKCPELAHAQETQGYTEKGEPEKFNEHPAIDDWNDGMGYFIHRRFPIQAISKAPEFF
jgi:PBSX family phage terminase large subunit